MWLKYLNKYNYIKEKYNLQNKKKNPITFMPEKGYILGDFIQLVLQTMLIFF